MVTRGLHPSGMKTGYPIGKKLRPAEVLVNGKGNLEWVVEDGWNELLSVTDLGLIVIADSVSCPTNHLLVSPFLLETGTSHHREESVRGWSELNMGKG